jgi:hypothetical protein
MTMMTPPQPTRETRPPPSWPVWARVAASLALVWHLAAVVLAPLSSPPPASRLSSVLAEPFRPYQGVAFLAHGYRFFAPNPGPSHLVGYELEMPDGSIRRGRFPDLSEHWPRLLYHRHFMLSERLNDMMPPPEADVPAEARDAFQTVLQSYAAHLQRRHGARRVTLYLIEHGIRSPEEILAGKRLSDPETYRQTPPLVTFPEELP